MKKTSRLTPVIKNRRMSEVDARNDERRKVRAALDPQDAIAELYADDFADESFSKRALNSARCHQIQSAMLDELYEILSPIFGSNDEPLVELLDQWSRGEPLAREAIALMLTKRGMSVNDVRSMALLRALPNVRTLDHLQDTVSTRRDRNLVAFMAWERHKKSRSATQLNRNQKPEEGNDD